MFRVSCFRVSSSVISLLLLLCCTAPVQAQEPLLGEIKLFAGNFAPRGWALCDGQLLPISQYQALFSILGTMYGGDGRTTFALPDLRGRVAMHAGNGPGLTPLREGQKGGTETNTLTVQNLPSHSHNLKADQERATTRVPDGNVLAKSWPKPIYTQPGGTLADTQSPTTNTGGCTAVNNVQPYLGVNYIIALQGIFPSRN